MPNPARVKSLNKMKQNEIPNEVREYALAYMEDYEYSDNLRMACKTDPESEQDYLEIQKHGCCGFVDFVDFPFLIDGKGFYFGFNYGH